jgi:hypothetical protein
MGYHKRNDVEGNNPMYRSVTPYKDRVWDPEHKTYERTGATLLRYAGPYATVGPAKAARGEGGWIEVCHPVWERLEE